MKRDIEIHLYECGHIWEKTNGTHHENCPVCSVLKSADDLRAENQLLWKEAELQQIMTDSRHADTERLWQWARENLTGEIADQFWQIAANGHLMQENPSYQQRIVCLRHKAEAGQERIKQLEDALRGLLELMDSEDPVEVGCHCTDSGDGPVKCAWCNITIFACTIRDTTPGMLV
jgi:hypothetical protein